MFNKSFGTPFGGGTGGFGTSSTFGQQSKFYLFSFQTLGDVNMLNGCLEKRRRHTNVDVYT